MSSKKLVIFAVSCLIMILVVFLFTSKNHRIIHKEVSAYSLSSSQLIYDFHQDYEAALIKYSNQTITISGRVTQKLENSLVIQDKIHCVFANSVDDLKPPSSVTIKGRCVGYDDLLHEIKMDQCILLQDE